MSESASDTAPQTSPWSFDRAIVWLLFLVSGACGLIYEVLWCRQLGLIFGNTVHSLSAVLTAFMSGLALGGYLSGRFCHKIKRPLFAYGVLEALIGLYCAALPWLFSDASPVLGLFRSMYGETGSDSLAIARFVIAFLLLLVPTTFMGATLPLLTSHLVRASQTLGRTAGALYAVNTLGAVAGAAATGFFLLPGLGKSGTNHLAVACNIVLGIIAVAAGAKAPAVQTQSGGNPGDAAANSETQPAEKLSSAVKLSVLAFGVTGFAAMAIQIGWTRAISLAIGSSTYAFSLIVSVFILGLAGGGAWGARVAPRLKDPVATLAKVLLAIGFLSLMICVLLGYGPIFFFFLLAWGTTSASWPLLLACQALGIGLLIIVPTFLMGMTMPLTLQVAHRLTANPGRTVGTVYAVNTVGAILGSLLGGLVLLPALTIQYTLVAMSLLYALPGLALFLVAPTRMDPETRRPAILMTASVLLLAVIMPRWNPLTMCSGSYLLRDSNRVQAAREFRILDAVPNRDADLIYYKEGAAATVAVTRNAEFLTLTVGGKPDASSYGDMSTQICLTLLPELIHAKGPEEVLVIGLGSGVSVGSALAPESIKRVDVVEMSPEVVEASAHFAPHNWLTYSNSGGAHPWLNTPKVELLINDGRNHLRLSSRKYDVIASEPSNPWMAGVGNLFTRESFELCRSHLKPGGIMCQWIHSYSLGQQDFFSIVRTFAEIFPNHQLWTVSSGDYVLIGSEDSLRIPVSRLLERLKETQVQRWLSRVHFDRPEELLGCYLRGTEELTDMVKAAEIHTDDNMLLEFSAPRMLYANFSAVNVVGSMPHPEGILDMAGMSGAERRSLIDRLDATLSARECVQYVQAGFKAERQRRLAFEFDPYLRWSIEYVNLQDEDRADELIRGTVSETADPDYKQAIALLEGVRARSEVVIYNRNKLDTVRLNYAEYLIARKNADAAIEQASLVDPAYLPARQKFIKARALMLKKQYDAAAALVNEALNAGGDQIEGARLACEILIESGHPDEGNELLRTQLLRPEFKTNPACAQLWHLRADLLRKKGELDSALITIRHTRTLRQENSDDLLLEGSILMSQKNYLEALKILRRRVGAAPDLRAARADLASAELQAASAASDPVQNLWLLRSARRTAAELCRLEAAWPLSWEKMGQACARLMAADALNADVYREKLQEIRARLLALQGGDESKLPAELKSSQ